MSHPSIDHSHTVNRPFTRRSGVWLPSGVNTFFILHCVQSNCGAHPAVNWMVSMACFLGSKATDKWIWQLISIHYWGWVCLELYSETHRIHDVPRDKFTVTSTMKVTYQVHSITCSITPLQVCFNHLTIMRETFKLHTEILRSVLFIHDR